MGLFNNWQLLIIRLLCFLGWFSTFALAQPMGDVLTAGYVEFDSLGVIFIANLVVFITCLIRGRLDVEIGARDVLDILSSPKLNNINSIQNGKGLTTCTETTHFVSTIGCLHTETTLSVSTRGCLHNVVKKYFHSFRQLLHNVVKQHFQIKEGLLPASIERKGLKNASVVMLSYGKPNLSITDFMRYNDPFVEFILLHFLPLRDIRNDTDVTAGLTPGDNLEMCLEHFCNCIVFWTVEEITSMLDPRMPGTLKQLSKSLCLLPCLTCLTNGCHGCNQGGLLPGEQSDEGYSLRKKCKVECQILDEVNAGSIRPGKPICICIPMKDYRCDKWTELLVSSLRSKDAESGGVRDNVSEAMKDYLAGGRGGAKESVKYNILSYILPRLIEIFINGLLTICFRVDGFSSSLIARRAVRDYLVDTKGSGLAANAFLTKAVVICDDNNTRVCQVLTFRTNLLGIRCLSFIVGCVNLLSGICWAVLISAMPWSSRRPSRPGVVVIIAAILIAFFMDVSCFNYSSYRSRRFLHAHRRHMWALFLALPFLAWPILALPVFISSALLILLVAMMGLFLSVLINSRPSRRVSSSLRHPFRRVLSDPGLKLFIPLFPMVLFLETFAIAILILTIESGEKHIGRWIYGALQALVWLKWAAGSCILNFEKTLEFTGESHHRWGILVHSSAFMLNAVLAGVRCKSKLSTLWPWKLGP